MAYFKHRRTQTPYQAAFRPEQPAYGVDADGDRLYTEEDYAAQENAPEDGDAFLPDEEELAADPGGYLPYEEFPLEAAPFDDTADGLYDSDPLDDDLLTEEEREYLRRSHWRLISGLADFAGVIAGTAVILILIALLVSLLNWLSADITQTFTLWQTKL